MVKPFMSDGYLTESKIGLEAGPEYGGPGIFVSSAIRSDVFPTAFWSLWEGANAVTCFHSKKKRKSRVRSKDTERYPVVELRHYGATCRALLQSNESELEDFGRKREIHHGVSWVKYAPFSYKSKLFICIWHEHIRWQNRKLQNDLGMKLSAFQLLHLECNPSERAKHLGYGQRRFPFGRCSLLITSLRTDIL